MFSHLLRRRLALSFRLHKNVHRLLVNRWEGRAAWGLPPLSNPKKTKRKDQTGNGGLMATLCLQLGSCLLRSKSSRSATPLSWPHSVLTPLSCVHT